MRCIQTWRAHTGFKPLVKLVKVVVKVAFKEILEFKVTFSVLSLPVVVLLPGLRLGFVLCGLLSCLYSTLNGDFGLFAFVMRKFMSIFDSNNK